MKIALIGHPGCGRSTLFRALAGSQDADTGKPLTVKVPDERLDFLSEVSEPDKEILATVVFVDIPSPIFAPRNLSVMRTAAVLALVIENYAIGEIAKEIDNSESELIIADITVAEKRLARLTKESKGNSSEADIMRKLLEHLEHGKPLRTLGLEQVEKDSIAQYAFLSLKPLIIISNRMGEPLTSEESVAEQVKEHGTTILPLDAGFELELLALEKEERGEFLESMGYDGSGLSRLIRRTYATLDLIVFFTIGKDEVRAWPVKRGSTALDAAGAIHSDLARGFIRAQVVPFDVYKECPDYGKLRKAGKIAIEGKNYIVNDGDIIEIRFNV